MTDTSQKDYTTIRIEREDKYEIDRIAAWHYKKTGETLGTDGIIKKMVRFFVEMIIKEDRKKE